MRVGSTRTVRVRVRVRVRMRVRSTGKVTGRGGVKGEG